MRKILRALGKDRYFYFGSILVFGAYLRPIFSEWVYSDEYHLFAQDSQARDHFNQDGSLVAGLIYTNISRNLVSNPADLWRLRILSLVCLLLVLKQIARVTYAKNSNRLFQFVLPLSLLLPAAMTFISWSLMWQASLAILISFLACEHWLKSKSNIRLIAIPLLSCALQISTYCAFTYFAFFAGIAIFTKAKTQEIFKNFRRLIILFGASGITTGITLLLYTQVFNLKLSGRVKFVELSDVPTKLYWVISRPLTASSRFFDISSPSSTNAAIILLLVLSIIVLGIVKMSNRNPVESFKYLVFYFSCVGLTLTPIIITSQNQIEFRYILGSSWLMFCAFVYFFFELISRDTGNLKIVTKSTVLLIVIAGTLTVNLNSERQFLSPYQSKVDFLKTQLLKCKEFDKNMNTIQISPPKEAFPSRKNLGMYSQVTDLASPWVPEPSVASVLGALNAEVPKIKLLEKRTLGKSKNCSIDLEEYRQFLIKSL